MEFNFTEDQLLLQETVRDFLAGECTVEHVRRLWETETARSPEFWSKFAEIGVPGLLVPEAHSGLGMNEIDFIRVLVEVGRAALAEPIVSTAVVAVPLLRDCGNEELAAKWLPKIATGDALVAVAQPTSPLVSDVHVADLVIARSGDALYVIPASEVRSVAQRSNDPSQKLFTIEFDARDEWKIANGPDADRLEEAALDRGALACAAQQLGACEQLIAMSVDYTTQRKQFGVPIGSFQAVKHQVADLKVALEYARSLVEKAAHSVAHDLLTRSVDVSGAKISAGEAALSAAQTSLQVHGALGYTWEQDLHVWMRRAWTALWPMHASRWAQGSLAPSWWPIVCRC